MTARWMRFLRAIVAFLAFLAVRPAIAAPPVVDQVVLVAQAAAEHAPDAEGDPADDLADDRATSAAARKTLRTPSPNAFPAVASFVLVSHKYLRNCSLLR